MKNKRAEHIYIIGIGGKGLNSIAEFCISQGYQVSGSDSKDSKEIQNLRKKGVNVSLDQLGVNIDKKYSLIIYSSIIPESHPERVHAKLLNIKQVSRAEFLKYITDKFVRISVAGSHGKSTTSALATLAIRAGLGEINAITGAYIKELQSYQVSGCSKYCVVEACEYQKSFLHIPGDFTIVTALEKSHMEYFGTEDSMNQAFTEFVCSHKKDSTLIINGDIPKLRQICMNHTGDVITCGFNQSNDYVISDVCLKEKTSIFSIYKDGICIEEKIEVKIPGLYNILNIALVFILLQKIGCPTINYRKILLEFTGVGRRFELFQHEQTIYIDDFAHHPTQVKNLLSSIKQFFPDKKIVAVFEPRQYHLFKTFLKEYGSAFKWAEEVCVTDIVPALGDTDNDIAGLSTQDVIKSVQIYSKPKQIWYARSYQEIAETLSLRDLSNTVIATIGAGPIFKVRDLLVNKVQ